MGQVKKWAMGFCDVCGEETPKETYPDIMGCLICSECQAELDEEENSVDW